MKSGVENYIFWSKMGSGFEEPGGTPPPRIIQEYPPGRFTHLCRALYGDAVGVLFWCTNRAFSLTWPAPMQRRAFA